MENLPVTQGSSSPAYARLLKETDGCFMVRQPEDDGKFYFLYEKGSNFLQICRKCHWYIIRETDFSERLSIGVGLAEPEAIARTLYRMEHEEMRETWEAILQFVFFSSFILPDYLLYDSRFRGSAGYEGMECHYIHDYYPMSCKADEYAWKARHCVFSFKEGERSDLWAKIFSLCLLRLPAFHKIRHNAVLVPIPASTRQTNIWRYSSFCCELSRALSITDGFRTSWINYDREEMRGTVGEDKLKNLSFNKKYIDGKDVILVDDVCTTGGSMKQMGRKMLELGATSVMGMCLGKTVGC